MNLTLCDGKVPQQLMTFLTIRTKDEDIRRRCQNIIVASLILLIATTLLFGISLIDELASTIVLPLVVAMVTQPLVVILARRGFVFPAAALLLVALLGCIGLYEYVIGGQFPFSLLVVPVLVAATTLPARIAAAVSAVLVLAHVSLALMPADALALPIRPIVDGALVIPAITSMILIVFNAFATDQASAASRLISRAIENSPSLEQQIEERTLQIVVERQAVKEQIAEREQAEEALRQEKSRVQLLQEVVVAANKSESLEEAVQICLHRICEHMDWLAGHVYLATRETNGDLTAMVLWHVEHSRRFGSTPSRAELGRLAAGGGLLARVLDSGKPDWIADILEEPDFKQAHRAESLGVRGLFAFPVRIRAEIVAIVEFFSDRPVEPDRALLSSVRHIGTQLGRVIERSRSAEALRSSEEALKQANVELRAGLLALEQRTREITLLSKMGEKLRMCHTADEAYRVAAEAAMDLFAGAPGGIWMLQPDHGIVERVTTWGASLEGRRVFAVEECLALGSAGIHTHNDPEISEVCRHLSINPPAGAICVPLIAQNQSEMLGLLHMQLQVGSSVVRMDDDGISQREATQQWLNSIRELASTVAEQVALSLTNLRLQESLRLQAIRDPLTGIYNRRYMQEALDGEIRRVERTGQSLSLIMLDLDHFKQVNDTYGHPAGDTLLRKLAEVIQHQIRAEDIACRYGGEEFAIIMPNSSLDSARRCAERIREELRSLSVEHKGQALGQITLSLGVASYPDHGPTSEALVQSADAALYRAKRGGRDQVVLSDVAIW